MTTAAATERFIIGTRENVEAEYGAVSLFDGAFVVVTMYADEIVSIEDFNSAEAAKAALAEIEDRSMIEWLF